MPDQTQSHYHDIAAIAAKFPDTAETILVDTYLSDEPGASARVFKIFHSLPAHFHRNCDEHLYVYSGELLFQIGDDDPQVLTPGQLVTFKRDAVHAILEVRKEPAIFMSFDTPRRAPDDVTFVAPNPEDRKFVSPLSDYL